MESLGCLRWHHECYTAVRNNYKNIICIGAGISSEHHSVSSLGGGQFIPISFILHEEGGIEKIFIFLFHGVGGGNNISHSWGGGFL